MGRITYLLGAGASYNAMPVMDNMKQAVDEILDYIDKQIPFTTANHQYLKPAVDYLNIIHYALVNHKSVDTYAKMLWSKKLDKEYTQLKFAIVLFFELYSYLYRSIDKRYDAFFASIISQDEPRLPKDIKIISWNYDYEFEKAYMSYAISKQNDNIHSIYDELNVVHKNSKTEEKEDCFEILKVNGTAGFFDTDGNIILGLGIYKEIGYDVDSGFSREERVKEIMNTFYKFITLNYTPAISYAWEKDSEDLIEKRISKYFNNCGIMVTIGYSFPSANRDVDSLILNKFDMDAIDNKIYIQNPDFYDVEAKLKEYKRYTDDFVEIYQKDYKNEFYLPLEYKWK